MSKKPKTKKTKDRWAASDYSSFDKDIFVFGPDDLRIRVDNDDVSHANVAASVRQMLALLNEHWVTPVCPTCKGAHEQVDHDEFRRYFEEDE